MYSTGADGADGTAAQAEDHTIEDGGQRRRLKPRKNRSRGGRARAKAAAALALLEKSLIEGVFETLTKGKGGVY